MNFFRIFAVSLLCAFTYSAHSQWYIDLQGENSGHSVVPFLTFPVSAEVLSRGLSTPGAFDATDMITYPANAAISDRNEFAITHLEWLMGLRNEYAAASIPLLDIGTIGLFSRFYTTGKITNSRDINEEISNPLVFDYSVGLSYARAFLRKRIDIGINAAFLESRLDDRSAKAVTGSADLLIAPSQSFSGHLFARNIGTSIQYNFTPEPLPTQAGISLLYRPIPRNHPILNSFDFSIGAGAQKTYDEPVCAGVSLGFETSQFLHFNAGYEYAYGGQVSLAGTSAGFGYRYGIYGFEGAWKYQSPDFGSVWAATIKVQMEELLPKSPDEYFAIAQKHFVKGRFNLCIYYAKKALKIDPNFWKAHALISKARAEMLRNRKLEIALIYTGNVRGRFIPYPPVPESPGGLSRQATVVKKIRSQFPVSISVDAGNIITGTANPLRAQCADRYYDYMKYNAVGLGEGEIDFGMKRYFEKARCTKSQFVCTNFNDPFTPDIVYSKIVQSGPYRFFVASVVGNSILAKGNKGKDLKPSVGELTARLLYPDARHSHLRIVVINDTWNSIKEYAQKVDGADIIICGSIDQRFERPMKIGSSLVLSAGSGGTYVGNFIMRFDENRKLISYDNHLIPLTPNIAPDTVIEDLVQSVTASLEFEEQGINQQELIKGKIDGTFPFVTDRDGWSCVYFKVADKLAEFPIGCGRGNCYSPSLSYKAGKIAFIEHDSCFSLCIMDINGAFKRRLQTNATVYDPVFSTDGSWLYYASSLCGDTGTAIYRVKPRGGPSYMVLDMDSAALRNPVFAPDGSLMLFLSNRDGTWQIYQSSPTGEQPLRMTDVNANHYKQSFSPDGGLLAYLSDRSNYGGKLDLWIYDRKAAVHRQITTNSNVKSYCWLPDSRTIIYSSGINLLDLNVTDVLAQRYDKLIKRDSVKVYNEVNPRIIRYKGREKVLYTREYGDGEKKIFWANCDGTEDKCVVDSKKADWVE